ncbi:glycosyltransferase family 2 protein [Riemerella anatipestifer]|uniref:glycosyltransferase family 2 protein n=1 Tax=Riemerella anatipestifer TaxID=34085 RepID=UPI0013659B9A|nr:glycosyltransferase family 2 protein [Riemerella anatipestifer]MCU7542735.1 glycosyltransferase [Riemerella anatipestifer]MCW0513520.1 glycosyltransferase [Riemerella anatipestifer]MDR7830726.1 glycosyltransferase family 2 protein [Riemerella anatipestifer]MDY3326262.1 glycosyltransferase family 2 protein [Riemerella anatipestifer]MWV19103.1 glycosyltransferase family 2 protein [Riemerella anatipestifer]
MNCPLLSVIIPVYNAEKSVLNTLESIKKQSYSNLQVIIINDGSTDDSHNVISEFIKDDNRFCLIYQNNAGVAAARTKGLQYVEGEYLIFSDADDIVLPDAYQYLVEEAIIRDSDILVGNYLKGDWENFQMINHSKIIENKDVFISQMLRGITHGGLCNKLFKIKIFDGIAFENGVNFMEDMLILIKILTKENVKISVVSEIPVYHYYLNKESQTNTISHKYLIQGDRVVENVSHLLKEEKFGEDIEYLKVNQKLLYLLNCDTYKVSIQNIYSEINESIFKMKIPLKYKILLIFENWGISFATSLFKKIKRIIQ